MEYYTTRIEVGLVFEYSSSLLGEIHEIADVVVRRDHLHFGNWFLYVDIGSRLGEIFWIGYIEICVYLSIRELTPTSLSSDIIVIECIDKSSDISRISDNLRMRTRITGRLITSDEYLVGDLGTRDDHVHIVLSPEALLDDIEVKKTEKSCTKSISQCW